MEAVQHKLYAINVLLLVLVAWCVPWWLYNRFVRTVTFHPLGDVQFPTPRWMSCVVPHVSVNPAKNKCESVKFDGWSIGHVLIYATVGLVLPGRWGLVLLISLACEAFEYAVGWRARWVIDPLANLVGYALGHAGHIDLSGTAWLSTGTTTVALAGVLVTLLCLNRPVMIPHGEEFV